jgi:hypothetical protein
MSHTPGPWRIEHDHDITIYSGDVPLVHTMGDEASEANARLIAATPDLLEALKDIVEDLEARWDMSDRRTNPGIVSCVEKGRHAIAKAEGR